MSLHKAKQNAHQSVYYKILVSSRNVYWMLTSVSWIYRHFNKMWQGLTSFIVWSRNMYWVLTSVSPIYQISDPLGSVYDYLTVVFQNNINFLVPWVWPSALVVCSILNWLCSFPFCGGQRLLYIDVQCQCAPDFVLQVCKKQEKHALRLY